MAQLRLKHYIILSFFLAGCLNHVGAQPERKIANHWFFGDHYGINFTQGTPQQDASSAMFTYESSTSMSDKDGNLLFYTNGGGRVDSTVLGYIWNRNHEVMEGGEMGALQGGGYSSAQGAVSIKKPGSPDQYFLFTIDELETLNTENNPFPEGKGLSWFEIDMAANGGLGKVTVSDQKLLTPAFEHLSATLHGNCTDYWLLARSGHGFVANDPAVADSFYLFKINESGIQDPIITPIPPEIDCAQWQAGMIRFSPAGEQFLCGAYLFDFDKNTGEIGDYKNLQGSANVDPIYPLAFSPNGRFLYYFVLTNEFEVGATPVKFYCFQIDLNEPDIFDGLEMIYVSDSSALGVPGTPQLAPDGKLYLPFDESNPNQSTNIYVVEKPNVKGAAADFHGPIDELLPAGGTAFLRFGNYTDHIFYDGNTISFDFDQPDAFIMDCREVEPVTLIAPDTLECFTWSTGQTSDTIEINAPGIYWLELSDGCQLKRDSFEVIYENNLFDINLGEDSTLCDGVDYLLFADVIPDVEYSWQDGSGLPFYLVETTGLYWLEMSFNDCFDSDSVYIEFLELPAVNIGNDTIICEEDELVLDAYGPANWTYEWQDGSMDTTFVLNDIGFYSVTVTNECGEASDDIFVNLIDCEACALEFPNIFSPDNDGFNDQFGVLSECNFISFNLKIFNRWGQVVFQGDTPDRFWDGTINGKDCPSDTYIYILEYESINPLGERKSELTKAELTLIR